MTPGKPTHRFALAMLAATVGLLAGGCAEGPAARVVQIGRLEPFAEVKVKLPPLAPDSMRLYVYRPQAFLGWAGSAIVVVDGHQMGDPTRRMNENLLMPGAVFVLDTPAKPTRVWWEQGGQGDESGKAIEVSPSDSRTWYLRWGLKPTHGFLQIVQEEQAIAEIEPLRMSGYVTLPGK